MNPKTLIIGSNGWVAAIEADTGRELWRTRLKTGGLISATSSEDIAVIVKDGLVFAGGAGHVFCLDLTNGSVLWHNSLDGMGYNEVSLAMEGVAVQFMSKVDRRSTNS